MCSYVDEIGQPNSFFPAEAHVSQNPVFMVIKVDLSCWWEEGMSQFSRYAVETMVQVGLQAVCVVDRVKADLNVCLFVSWHLPEAEWRDIAPHAKSFGNASTSVTGIYQVCRKREQPAQTKQYYVVNTGLSAHSSTAETPAKITMATVQTHVPKFSQALQVQLHCRHLIFPYISVQVGLILTLPL